ncbi:MAG: DNA methyltransferase [Lentisphaeria bacterium]
MPLSWNEIKQNAIRFSKEWATEKREEAEAKSFWDEFFAVFGIRRRTVATFEEPVKNLGGQFGYIDLFWRGKLLVEHKSFGKDLDKAGSQAFTYIQNLAASGRQDEIPRYVIVSDFARIALHDLEPEAQPNLPLFAGHRVHTVEFPLCELHRHLHAFAFMAGYQQHRVDPEDPANIRAAEIMGALHDAIATGGYSGHVLERFLVRILFCLFAEDTGIFEPNAFSGYLANHTKADGSDLGLHLAQIFQILDTAPDRRQANTPAELAAFPYVNGGLFLETLPLAALNREMRDALVACTRFNWSRISPAVFGSLFQCVMEPAARRQIGAHYTSERDILKVVRSLFLDDLRAEFARVKTSKPKLAEFHRKLATLRFFDPACGCGNFLVLTYRELRQLEMDVLEALHGTQQLTTDIHLLSVIDVDQFYGIEIEEFPALIAETALWLMDHQMNVRLSERMGQYFQRLPLKKAATIVRGNALRLNWKTILPPDQCSYILGNPPFVGKHYQNSDQRADMVSVFNGSKNIGDMDYVACWFYRAAEYIQDTPVRVGFVATNSITQGEQVPIVWGLLFGRYPIKIHFAHRTFAWTSEARGKAHVHVVIIGFGASDIPNKLLYDYEGEKSSVSEVRNISPYLTPSPDILVSKRTKPLDDIPEMRCGNKPSDGGNLILSDAEKNELLAAEPGAEKFLRRFTGSEEFINGNMRWCLWLKDASPSELRNMPEVMKRIQAVKEFREKSTATPTRKAADTPTLFFYISQPATQYILIPEVSSERRKYIPIGFMPPEIISANTNFLIPSDSPYLFGVLTSAMHMAWVKQVGGRLKSDFRYSGSMVYNTFPWPEAEAKRRAAIERCAQAVLDARAPHLAQGSTLADLYDPLAMPPELVKAHQALDRAVDLAYRPAPFPTDRARVEFLFARYADLTTGPLEAGMAAKPKRRKKRSGE